MNVAVRSLRLGAGALALVSVVASAGCRQLAERLNQGDKQPAPTAPANEPSAPSAESPPPALQPSGAVTPKT